MKSAPAQQPKVESTGKSRSKEVKAKNPRWGELNTMHNTVVQKLNIQAPCIALSGPAVEAKHDFKTTPEGVVAWRLRAPKV